MIRKDGFIVGDEGLSLRANGSRDCESQGAQYSEHGRGAGSGGELMRGVKKPTRCVVAPRSGASQYYRDGDNSSQYGWNASDTQQPSCVT